VTRVELKSIYTTAALCISHSGNRSWDFLVPRISSSGATGGGPNPNAGRGSVSPAPTDLPTSNGETNKLTPTNTPPNLVLDTYAFHVSLEYFSVTDFNPVMLRYETATETTDILRRKVEDCDCRSLVVYSWAPTSTNSARRNAASRRWSHEFRIRQTKSNVVFAPRMSRIKIKSIILEGNISKRNQWYSQNNGFQQLLKNIL